MKSAQRKLLLNWLFPILLICLLTLATVFAVHSSSIGQYFRIFNGPYLQDKNLIFGESRGVRSDEWKSVTPKIISQALYNDFKPLNRFVGLGELLPVMIGLPYNHWRILFHPMYLPFLFLPLDNAFAFSWWIGPCIMLISAFLLIKKFTKDYLVSVIGAFVFFFAPFNQWWTYTLALFLGYGGFALYFFLQLIDEVDLKKIVAHTLGLTYFSLCFIFILYPPFQISVGFFYAFFLIGFILKNRRKFDKKRVQIIFWACLFTIVTAAVFISLYYFEFKNTINIVQNTVYPGKRAVVGGGYNWKQLMNGFYNIQLLEDVKGSGPWANKSEASNFFLFYLFTAPAYLFVLSQQIRKKKIDWIFSLLIIYLLFSTIWLFVPFPTWFARMTLLYLVPPHRMLIGIGIADLILALYFLKNIKVSHTKWYATVTILCSLGAFTVNLYLGLFLNKNYPLFIQSKGKILMISLIAGGLAYLLLRQKKKLFIISLLLFSICSTYRVNPIYHGLDALINTSFARKIQQIERSNKNEYRWIVYGDDIFGQYIIANGGHSLSGVYLYPQFGLWRQFDPNQKYINIWNRYARISFVDDPLIKTKFDLLFLDAFKVNVNPCDETLKTLKVKYYVFIDQEKNYSCLKRKEKLIFPKFTVFIEERNDY